MKKAVVTIMVVGLTLSCCASLLSLAMEYRSEPVTQQPTWPDGLADLLNSRERVYGYFVNFSDYFYYSGDAKAFNSFVERYSKLQGTPLIVILHYGRGVTGSFDPKGETTIPFDWKVSVDVLPGLAGAARGPSPRAARVELWLGGQVDLKEVQIPLNVILKSGGEIEKFIADHEARRTQARNTEKNSPEARQLIFKD